LAANLICWLRESILTFYRSGTLNWFYTLLRYFPLESSTGWCNKKTSNHASWPKSYECYWCLFRFSF